MEFGAGTHARGGNSLGVRITLLQQPVVQLPGYSLTLVVKLINVSRTGVRDTHDGPQRFGFALALMGLVFSIPHLLRVVIENLGQMNF